MASSWSSPSAAHWFITCLFCSCVLYAAVDQRGPLLRGTAVAVATLLTAGAPQLAELPLAAGTALPAIVLIEAGRQLHRAERWLDGAVAAVAAALVFVLAGVAVAMGRLPRLDLKVGDFGQPVLGVAIALGISVALLVLSRRASRPLGERAGRAVTSAATAVVPVVLLHPLALEVPGSGDWTWLAFTAGLLVPWAIALARTRLSGWTLGH